MQENSTCVLVVDDERFFREAIQEALAADGLECRTAASGAQAIEEAADPRIGVIVLDMQLPDGGGLEVLRRLRQARPAARVVVLSAHTDQEYVLEALRLGACDYLAKPLHEEELCLSVRRALETFRVASRSEVLQRRVDRMANEAEGLVAAANADGRAALAARAAEAAARLLDAGKTSLVLLEQDGRELRVAAATGRSVPLEQLSPVPIGGGVAGWAVAHGETLLVPDIRADERFAARAWPDRYDSTAFLVVPVGRAVTHWGALCATDRAGGECFGEEDAALLGVLAQLLVPLLGPTDRAPSESEPAGATAHDESDAADAGDAADVGDTGAAGDAADAHAELARLVCEAMTSEIDPTRLLAAALRAVGQQLLAAPISVYLADPESGQLAREAQWEGAGVSDRAWLPRACGLTGSVFETGHPVASDRPAKDPRFVADADTPEGGQEAPILIVPLRFRNKTLGVCRAFPAEASAASPRTAEVLGAALSAAVRNVALYRSLLASIEEVARVRREGRGRN